MNPTSKLLLAGALCACLAGALYFQAVGRQTNGGSPQTSSRKPLNPTPEKNGPQLRHPPVVTTKTSQSRYRATRNHKDAVRLFVLMKHLDKLVYQKADHASSPEEGDRQRAILQKRYAAVLKSLTTVQRSFEKQLRQNSSAEQRVFIQNDLADVHIALAHASDNVEQPKYTQVIAHLWAAYRTDKVLRPVQAGKDLRDIASTYFDQGLYRDAVMYSQQAERVFHQSKDQNLEAYALYRTAVAYQAMGHYYDALQTIPLALALYKKLKDQNNTARELAFMGDIYSALGYSAEASKNYRAAISIYHNIDKGTEATTWIDVADIYKREGNYREALNALNKAVSLYREFKSGATERIDQMTPKFGEVYSGMNNYKEARRYFDLALKRMRRHGDYLWQGIVLCDLGNIKLKQHLDKEALALFKQSLPMLKRANRTEGQMEVYALAGMTTAYANLKQPRRAIVYGKQAINILQSIRQKNRLLEPALQRAFLAQHRVLYEQVAALLVKQQRQEEAEQVLRFLRQEDAFEFVRREPDLAEGLSGLFEPLEFTPDESKLLDRSMAQTIRINQGCRESRLWQQALREQEKAGRGCAALISTFNTDDTFYLLLTTAKSRRAFSVPIKRRAFDRLSRSLCNAVSHNDGFKPDIDPRPDALKMYRIVFADGKLEHALHGEGITTALWFASGTLRLISIDTLYDGTRYLVQKPCANVYVTLTSRQLFGKRTRGRALAVGVSQEQKVKAGEGGTPIIFHSLPSVAQEVRSIVDDPAEQGRGPFPGKILLNQQFVAASVERYLKQGASILHLATHYVLNPRLEQEPYFVQGDGERLSLSQWKQTFQLQGVGLLTLSACKTGVGSPDTDGGDVSSIGELSQFLGAQSVVATLWPVDDSPTTTLMSDFYAQLHRHPNRGKAWALRSAQLDMMNRSSAIPGTQVRYPTQDNRGIVLEGEVSLPTPPPAHPYEHPYYWGAFSLIGNWK